MADCPNDYLMIGADRNKTPQGPNNGDAAISDVSITCRHPITEYTTRNTVSDRFRD